jgi:hypothetical protein
LNGTDWWLLSVAVLLALLEGTHATAVEEIGRKAPEVLAGLGRTGPGYYFFRVFQTHSAYRKALSSGQLEAKLQSHPRILRLLIAERALWLAVWVTFAAGAVFGVASQSSLFK